MKQGEKFLQRLMLLLTAVVLSYFGYAAWRYFSAPLATVTALRYEASEGASAVGYVVREETVLTASQPIVAPVPGEGEHVGTGQTLALAYRDEDAQQHQAEITNLQAEIAVLKQATDDTVPASRLDTELEETLTTFCARTARGQSSADDDTSAALKGLALRRGLGEDELTALRTECATLQRQLDALRGSEAGGAAVLTAPETGYFSAAADGYEDVLTPAAIDTLTNADLDALTPGAVPAGAYGKLITSDTWYFVTQVEQAVLGDAAEGDSVQLGFSRRAGDDIPMTIVRIGAAENGMCLLALSCDRFVRETTQLRRQTCTLKFRAYSGLRIPAEALRTNDEGTQGVYVLEGAVARFKPVELVYEMSETYVIVALDTSSTKNLWPGDEILLGDGLYDGKVVYK